MSPRSGKAGKGGDPPPSFEGLQSAINALEKNPCKLTDTQRKFIADALDYLYIVLQEEAFTRRGAQVKMSLHLNALLALALHREHGPISIKQAIYAAVPGATENEVGNLRKKIRQLDKEDRSRREQGKISDLFSQKVMENCVSRLKIGNK